jgi:hypothetical protein
MRLDSVNRLLLVIAGLWSVVPLLGASFLVPTYSSSSVSSSSAGPAGSRLSHTIVHSSSQTVVQVNGFRVLFLLALPLLAVGVVAFTLWRRGQRGQAGPGALAWTVTGLVGAVSLLGILSIGIFIMPIVVLLLVVCGRTASLGSQQH